LIAQADIHSALMGHLQTVADALADPVTVVWPGKPAVQADYWLRPTVLHNLPQLGGMDAATPLVHRGILQMDLFCELGRHEAVYLARGDELAAHWPQNLRLVWRTAAVTVQRCYCLSGRSTGDHWLVPVRAEYIAGSN